MAGIKNKQSPTIITNVNGTILGLKNVSVLSLCFLKQGDSVFSVLEPNDFRKASMYSRRISVVNTKIAEYPHAIVRSRGDEFSKSIEITLLKDSTLTDEQAKNIDIGYGVYTRKSGSGTTCELVKAIEKIICEIKNEKRLFVGNDISLITNEECFVNVDSISVGILLTTTILSIGELDSANELKITVTPDGLVEFTAKTRRKTSAITMEGLIEIYPHLMPKLTLIKSICEDEAIKIKVLKTESLLTLSYEIPVGKKGELVLKSGALDSERLKSIISSIMLISIT